MRLSDSIIDLERVFTTFLTTTADQLDNDRAHSHRHTRRIRRDISLQRNRDCVPIIPDTFDPLQHTASQENQIKLLQLNAFEASLQDHPTPFSPDMFPIIIDTGASITISPYTTDFSTPIRPVQNLEIKGIASGLKIMGVGDITYHVYDDEGNIQTLTLKNSLYVPQCSSRILCPRQLAMSAANPQDCFIAGSANSTLICNGKPITVQYDMISNLPILFTAPGISSYKRFHAHSATLSPSSMSSAAHDSYPSSNLTANQQKKL